MFGATLLLALREIRRHLMRSFLTTLGIIIGVAGVITMVTLGNGAKSYIGAQISSLGSNAFYIFPAQIQGRPQKPFHASDIDAVLDQIAGVKAVAGEVNRNVQAFHNGQDWTSRVEGVGNGFMDARGIGIDQGRRFTSGEESSGANVCIVGPKVLTEIFVQAANPLGEQMRLDGVSCTVIGTFKSRAQGNSNQDDDNAILMPIKTVQRRFVGNDDIFYMVVSYDPAYDATTMQNSLVGLMRERRLLLSEEQPNDFNMINSAQVNDTVQTTLSLMTALVALIAGISLLVGGIGIMNIMLVSVTERTREIGIRLAIGALAREVRLQFLTEAVVLCCFGGIVGLILAFLISYGLASAIAIPFVFDPVINLIAFVFCGVMGTLFGYYPARRASKLDPIDALRHE